ncbi:MAG: TrkH family potassium uptake protein [Dehalococcoidia bacterium]|nr:TrkH family potassium uptake protein [Dehalococcoidia bacterium]MDD5493336.1 TrkH family potassium uptake protein [Dehalococcoidia bacterium]
MSNRRKDKRKFSLPSLVKPWRISLTEPLKRKNGEISPLLLVFGFAALIIVGTVLLILPISSRSGHFTAPVDALFTATSAVCVTGLLVQDTGTYWSLFGQAVILILIQIGGLGFMTSATLFLIALGRRIGLREKLLIVETMGIMKLGGLVSLIRKMALFALIVEGMGTAIFYVYFSANSPTGMPLWESLFHAVSAFNNAGFDIFGDYQSLIHYQNNAPFLLTTAGLIIIGGISFVVVADIFGRRRFINLALDSKIVLSTTACLLLGGTLIILFTEFSNVNTLGTMPLPQKLLIAFFQSTTARTAGFSAINMGEITHYCLFFIIILMFIGGASGSTAGGIKVNTFGILVATLVSALRGKEYAGAFNKEFVPQQIYRALAVVILSLGIITTVVFLLTITERYDFLDIFFETVSAFANVGLSSGITPDLSVAGRLIISATVFIGRLGPLTLALLLIERQQTSIYRYPQENVRIG